MQDGKYGLTNNGQQILTPQVYDEIIKIDYNNYCYAIQNGYPSIINSEGEELISPKIKYFSYYDEDTIFHIEDTLDLVSYFDINKKKEIYSHLPFYLKHNGHNYCLADQNGTPQTDWYKLIHPMVKGKALAIKNKTIGFIDIEGHFSPIPSYEIVTPHHNIYDFKLSNNKHGILDSCYNEIIPAEYDSIYFEKLGNNILIVKKDDKYGIIDINGKIVCPLEYDPIVGNNACYYLIAKKEAIYTLIPPTGIPMGQTTSFQCEKNTFRTREEGCGGSYHKWENGISLGACIDGFKTVAIGYQVENNGSIILLDRLGKIEIHR